MTSRKDTQEECISAEVGEQERLSRALAGSAVDPFFALVERSHDAVFISSAAMESLYVNPAWERIWGRQRESLEERPFSWMEAIHPEDAAWLREHPAKAGTDWAAEFRVVRPDGSLRWVRSRSFPIPDAEGRLHRIVGFAEDVTESRQAELALREAKEAAERASRAKTDFLAIISHELRTPLNAILGFSEILADGHAGALNEQQASYLDHILVGGRRLLELVNDLLDLAKIEAERLHLERADFDLSTLVLDLETSMKPMAVRAEIILTLDQQPGMPAMHADPRRMKQVVFNLLSNALKFTPVGGEVTVRTSWRDGRFRIAVEDNGIGIRPADQERLFRVFELVDASYTRTKRGSGLGLALSRGLVELHGGRIWVESAGEGRGSTFTFEIPGSTA
jgi:PAS domain S-box-containing protein